MRLVGAGWGRTGTTSAATAVERLGGGPVLTMQEMWAHPEPAEVWLRHLDGAPVDWPVALARLWERDFGGWAAVLDREATIGRYVAHNDAVRAPGSARPRRDGSAGRTGPAGARRTGRVTRFGGLRYVIDPRRSDERSVRRMRQSDWSGKVRRRSDTFASRAAGPCRGRIPCDDPYYSLRWSPARSPQA